MDHFPPWKPECQNEDPPEEDETWRIVGSTRRTGVADGAARKSAAAHPETKRAPAIP
jgi:hypothetical protein